MDKVTFALLAGLKQALAEPAEQRLFRSGKLPGLFPARGADEAAEVAVREGLLEVVRSETRGKVVTEWVRPTPRAVEFVHAHESPAVALYELRDALRATENGWPGFADAVERQLRDLSAEVLGQVRAMGHRLQVLTDRVEDAIARAEAARTALPEPLHNSIPWAGDALNYLERRGENSTAPCPLSELFLAVRSAHPGLTLSEFHTGLRRLSDRSLVRLLPLQADGSCAEPEYALLDGVQTFYFVSRVAQAA